MSCQRSGMDAESCNCASACPRVFLSDPTHGDCTVLIGWHIEQGQHDARPLDGLTVAMAVEGNMATTPWRVAASSDRLCCQDHGRSWSLSERTALFSPFTYQS